MILILLKHKDGPGDGYLPEINLINNWLVKQQRMQGLLHESWFCAAKMTRGRKQTNKGSYSSSPCLVKFLNKMNHSFFIQKLIFLLGLSLCCTRKHSRQVPVKNVVFNAVPSWYVVNSGCPMQPQK